MHAHVDIMHTDCISTHTIHNSISSPTKSPSSQHMQCDESTSIPFIHEASPLLCSPINPSIPIHPSPYIHLKPPDHIPLFYLPKSASSSDTISDINYIKEGNKGISNLSKDRDEGMHVHKDSIVSHLGKGKKNKGNLSLFLPGLLPKRKKTNPYDDS